MREAGQNLAKLQLYEKKVITHQLLKYRLIMERLDKILTLISQIQAPINSSISPHKGKN